jgi:hypothetical protein
MQSDDEWFNSVIGILQAEMLRRGTTYEQVPEMLADLGRKCRGSVFGVKSRAVVSPQFYLSIASRDAMNKFCSAYDSSNLA